MDRYPPSKRSDVMKLIGSKNSLPEVDVRRIVHHLGYRFRIHDARLPGRPDIVLPRHRKIIFVHGCFWHGHSICRKGKLPKTNLEFWRPKIFKTRKRDQRIFRNLHGQGWRLIVVWACGLKNRQERLKTIDKLRHFLER